MTGRQTALFLATSVVVVVTSYGSLFLIIFKL